MQAPTPLLGGIQMAALGAAICNAFNQKVEQRNASNQALSRLDDCGLATKAGKAVGTYEPRHIL